MKATPTPEARQAEFDKYEWAYKDPQYRMEVWRRVLHRQYLRQMRRLGFESFLDVGTGRGESLDDATEEGYTLVSGFEVIDDLCDWPRVVKIEGIHKLPAADDSYDLVSCNDVFEHILEGDVRAGISELIRVAKRRVYMTVAWFEAGFGREQGIELHVTRKPLHWWQKRVLEAMPTGAAIRVGQVKQKAAIIEVNLDVDD